MKVRLPNGEKYDGVWLNGQMQRAFSIRNRRNAEPVIISIKLIASLPYWPFSNTDTQHTPNHNF